MSNSSQPPVESFSQYQIGNDIWIYCSPILLLVGTVGNTISILVLLRKRLRVVTTMFYLTCLSVGDLLSLYTGLLRLWAKAAFEVDFRTLSDASCKIHTFLVYVALDFTVWTLVAVTVDRCLSVSMPFRAKRLCTLQRARYVISVIILFTILKNMHFLWNLGLVTTWEFRCDGKTEAINHFLRYVWHWIDFSTFCFIPFTIMIVCNMKIIYEMLRSQKKLNAHNTIYQTKSPNKLALPAEVSEPTLSRMSALSRGEQLTNEQEVTSQPKLRPKRDKISSLTVMLLSVNCIFLLTTSPVQAFLIGEQSWFLNQSHSTERLAWHNFYWAIVNMLQYLNNAIHLFLYCLTGPRFRQELKSMFKRKHRISVTTEHSNTDV